LGELWANWLHVKTLWIDKMERGKGYGRKLTEVAERFAIERGYRNAYLSTHSFQARPLYEKLGYEVFGELEDFPPGYSKYYMRKQLN
jgi:ribosomal protein S18 acetylase RimI-like enzyme